MRTEWRPLRFGRQWPRVDPVAFNPNTSIFIPELSVSDNNVRDVSSRKVAFIGIKVYDNAGNNTGVADNTQHSVVFDTIDFNRGFQTPNGATWTTVTIPITGVYDVFGITQWNYSGATDSRINLYVNGSSEEGSSATTTSIKARRDIAVTRRFTQGDTLGLRVLRDDVAGANRDIDTGASNCALAVMLKGTI